MRTPERFNAKLLVEGKDDQHVIWALCNKFNIPENFDVIDCEGVENLIKQVPVRLKQSGIKALGVVVDADESLKQRLIELKNILQETGCDIKEDFPQEGFIQSLSENQIRIGIWLMPNNNSKGTLEDFIRFLIPPSDNLLPLAKNTLQSIEEKGLSKYLPQHHSKALIHTWLAWQEYPGTPLGLAITKKYLDTDEKNCQTFVKWIKNLFDNEAI